MAIHISNKAHALSIASLVSQINTDVEKGLDNSEVQKRLDLYGENRLKEQQQKSIVLIFIEQFLDPVIYVLLLAAILGFSFGEVVEGMAIAIVILITVLIGFFMEWQARRSMHALQEIAVNNSTVIRGGKETVINDHYIVPGDILILTTGDVVPADARILNHESLAVKESALTGESQQVDKSEETLQESTPLADRHNMVFKGTLVTRGTGKVMVTSTGDLTEVGAISKLTMEAKEEITPLEKKLNILSKKLIWLALILAFTIGLVGYIQGRELRQMIETAFALAVAAIPEGLPIVTTIALARGLLRLAKDRVIIKELNAVETLGSVGIICTDKTGTLTENKMAAHTIIINDEELALPKGKDDHFWKKHGDRQVILRLLETGILCNNVPLHNKEDELSGEPIEIALIKLAQEAGYDIRSIRSEHLEIVELPFDTETKMMATLNTFGDAYRVSAKGAVENILNHCEKIFIDGVEKTFCDKNHWLEVTDRLASKGFRTLAFSYKDVVEPPKRDQLLEHLVFLGLIGFLDPPRADVKDAIQTCHRAGIKVVMITGDHPETARNIADAVGLLDKSPEDEEVLTGQDIVAWGQSNKKNETKLLESTVFARVTPSQKLELVTFYQKHNYVVGMTGDGVNDAPALKKADIGIAMGIRGTEAAKEVADVILRDDQFSSIELAIHQGRIIFENIRKFVVYLLSSNLAEIAAVAIAALVNLPLPLLPLQILYLNLVTDVFPALSLTMGEGESNIMNEKPRAVTEPIMPRSLWASTVVYGLGITVGVVGINAFAHLHLGLGAEKVNNMAFYTLVFAQLLNIFNLPKRKVSFFNNEITRNIWVWLAILLCILLTIMGYLIEPLRDILSLVPLTYSEIRWVVAFSFGSLVVTQIVKRLGWTV